MGLPLGNESTSNAGSSTNNSSLALEPVLIFQKSYPGPGARIVWKERAHITWDPNFYVPTPTDSCIGFSALLGGGVTSSERDCAGYN